MEKFEQEYDKMLDQSGGIGRFQIYLLFVILCGMNATTMLYNSLSYLELEPEYECNFGGLWTSCNATYICAHPNTDWQYNYNCTTCLHNWVEKLDLTCEPKSKIGLIGSTLWMGWVTSLLFVPRLADIFGR